MTCARGLAFLCSSIKLASASSMLDLAARLYRDYKNVYEDVEKLTAAGVLDREGGHVTAPYGIILAEMSLAPA